MNSSTSSMPPVRNAIYSLVEHTRSGQMTTIGRRVGARPLAHMPGSESMQHRHLKRLALQWASQQGYTIAAAEVSVPRLGRCRLDVAAYRPAAPPARKQKTVAVGATAIFECKQSRADFLKDAQCEVGIHERLVTLRERRALYEEFLRGKYPSLRHGDELFPEWDGYHYEAAGYAPYDELLAEIKSLSKQLHARTKFAKLARWNAANLHYVVAEPGLAKVHELPTGWGLLERTEEGLGLVAPATWNTVQEEHRWNLLLCIGVGGTREVRRSHGLVGAYQETPLPGIIPPAE